MGRFQELSAVRSTHQINRFYRKIINNLNSNSTWLTINPKQHWYWLQRKNPSTPKGLLWELTKPRKPTPSDVKLAGAPQTPGGSPNTQQERAEQEAEGQQDQVAPQESRPVATIRVCDLSPSEFKMFEVACKAGPIIPTTLAVILRGSAICICW